MVVAHFDPFATSHAVVCPVNLQSKSQAPCCYNSFLRRPALNQTWLPFLPRIPGAGLIDELIDEGMEEMAVR